MLGPDRSLKIVRVEYRPRPSHTKPQRFVVFDAAPIDHGEIGVWVDEYVPDLDLVVFARARLHRLTQALAEKTGGWARSQDELDALVPPPQHALLGASPNPPVNRRR